MSGKYSQTFPWDEGLAHSTCPGVERQTREGIGERTTRGEEYIEDVPATGARTRGEAQARTGNRSLDQRRYGESRARGMDVVFGGNDG